jgi:transcriptional regulator GlxA family with amidase domain
VPRPLQQGHTGPARAHPRRPPAAWTCSWCPAITGWIGKISEAAAWTASVCSGALLLHAAGPARGRRVPTHHASEDTLQARGDITVVRDTRYIVDGQPGHHPGVFAGIDMAL